MLALPIWIRVVIAFAGSIAKSVMGLWMAAQLGRRAAETEALQEEKKRIELAKQAEDEAEHTDKPDPFLRD